jgi:hypothetical protein
MASNNNAVDNFEQWRKNKASADKPASEVTEEVVSPESKSSAPNRVEPDVSALSAFFAKAAASLAALTKSGVARIKLVVAPKEKAQKTAKAVDQPTQKKTAPKPSSAEKASLASKLKAFPARARATYSEAAPRNKKITVVSVIAGAVLVIAIVLLTKFELVTPDGGIKTSLGSAKGTTVLIEKGAAIAPNDLIVAVQPGSPEDAPELIIGTVFSSNEETYALYDGEVIWQIPLADLKGKVLFAEATQKLP